MDAGLTELVSAVSDRANARRLEAGEVLCHKGDPGDSAFVVSAGHLEARNSAGAAGPIVAIHQPGALIGEITAVAGGTRTATLSAAEVTDVLEIPGTVLGEWLDRNPEAADAILHQARQRMDRTRLIGVLADVLGETDPAIELADQTAWLELTPGETLFEADDPTAALYVVLAGRLADDERRVAWGRSDLLGELGVLDGGPHLATATAKRPTTIAAIPRSALEATIARHPRLAAALVRHALRQPSRARDAGGRWVTVAVVGDSNRRLITGPLVKAAEPHGSARLVSAAAADSDLERPGLSDSPPGGPGAARLAEYFHHLLADFDVVIAETGAAASNWTRRCVAMSDLVLVVVPDEPTDRDRADAIAITGLADEATEIWLVVLEQPGSGEPRGSADFLASVPRARELHHLRLTNPNDSDRLARLATGHGRALVLGGGGARGFAHVGVIRAFEELGYPIDRVGGASIGAVIAATIAQEVGWEEMATVVAEHFHRLLDYTVPIVSLLKGKRITDSIERRWGEVDVEDLRIPFFCTSTNLTRSRVEVHRRGSVSDAIRASVAIPGVLPPVPSGEDLLVDGGVLNNLPVDIAALDKSVETIIAVDVAPSLGPRARADFGLSVSGWEALRAQLGRGKADYPGLAAVLTRSMLVGAARDRDRHLSAGLVDLLLDLDLRGVGLLEFEVVRPVVDRGYEQARPRIEAWLGVEASEEAVG